MAGPNEIDPPQPTPFEALVRRLAEEANTPETVSVDDLLNGGRLTSRYLERFARLVAEECAKLCLERQPELERFDVQRAAGSTARGCARSIRAAFGAAPEGAA